MSSGAWPLNILLLCIFLLTCTEMHKGDSPRISNNTNKMNKRVALQVRRSLATHVHWSLACLLEPGPTT